MESFCLPHYSVVMARNNPFYFRQDESKQSYDGVDVEFVKALSQGLRANFSVSSSPVRSWGSCSPDGNCTGMIGMLQRNEFDVALSGMSLSFQRHRFVDFSFPYLLDRVTFVVRSAKPLDPADAIIRPFAPEVWLFLVVMIGVSLVIRIVCLRLPERFHKFATLLEIHGLLLGKGLQWVPCLISQRLLLCLWLMLSLVLSTSYCGMLFSSMTHPGLENIIDSIEKLATGLKEGVIVCGTMRGTDFEKALQQEHPLSTANQLILQSLASDANSVEGDIEGLQRVQRESYAYIGEYIGVLADVSESNSVTFAPDSFQMGAYGVAMRRGLGITERVNRFVAHLWEAGLVRLWLKKYTNSDEEWISYSTADPLNIHHMAGVVHILSGGAATSLVAILVEALVYYVYLIKHRHKLRILLHNCRLLSTTTNFDIRINHFVGAVPHPSQFTLKGTGDPLRQKSSTEPRGPSTASVRSYLTVLNQRQRFVSNEMDKTFVFAPFSIFGSFFPSKKEGESNQNTQRNSRVKHVM